MDEALSDFQAETAHEIDDGLDELYVIPLTRRPFFPGMAAPLVVDPGRYYETLKEVARSKYKAIGLLLTQKEDMDLREVGLDDLHSVGVVARVLRIIPMDYGGVQVVLNMDMRFTVLKGMRDKKHLRAKVSLYKDQPEHVTEELKAYSISIISTIKELLKLNPLFQEELQIFLGHSDFTEPGKLADFAVALTTASREELQDVLQTFDLQARIDKALILLRKEVDLSKLQNRINKKIETSISSSQREFFLREQLKTIKRELGIEKDEKTADIEKFQARLEKREVPEDVMDVIQDELEKLSALETQSSEYGVCRHYLDWLTIVPWGIKSEDTKKLKTAQKILEEDHYGLEDVKKRIVEFIGVGLLSGSIKGSIICFIGPPGVGKTSIGKSIARALGRKFFRFSVGGMRDEAEIKGHRRTYVGAMPGKLIQAFKYCQTMNPVILIDEIDKMAHSSAIGDPSSALLEVLDPEQNSDFLDHYLDVRVDLSEVLFLTTANVLDEIPDPLRDRMEIVRLSGYIQEEKLQIAQKYLIPRHRKAMGLKSTQVTFSKVGLSAIIEGYAREAGVRTLENMIKKVLRKIALKVVQDKEGRKKSEKAYTISKESLKEYLGQPTFTSDRYYDLPPVGVSVGLAWTSMGGATLYIEAIDVAGGKEGGFVLTGQAGDVMKESSQIAWSYAKSHFKRFFPNLELNPSVQVHMHFPEGATPKDGPSAGITMVCALLSLFSKTPIVPDLAMTGELTLTGKVLPIGGVREKVVAARRSKISTLIFPKENRADYEELPAYLKKGLSFHFVDRYDDVFKLAFELTKDE